MISKLARRLGFQQSVPVSLVDGWTLATLTKTPIEVAPREGAASCLVDQFGRVQVSQASWALDLTLAAGARWVANCEADRIKQKLIAPGVVETTIQTPSGPVVQRVAGGVVDGQPVAVIEVENTAGVAIAVAAVARPITIEGRGFMGDASVATSGMTIDGARQVRFDTAPASVAAIDGTGGDLLQQLPDPADGTKAASAASRSGAAQLAAVWPLPYTATLRLVVELTEPTSPNAAIPTTDDINRGWAAHLKQGVRVDVDELEVGEQLGAATRSVLTLWPEPTDVALAVTAISEAGFGRDAGRFFAQLDRCDDDAQVVRSLARWAQLGEQQHQLQDLERILGRLAQAAHHIVGAGGRLAGPAWLDDALVALGGRLHQIEQPDVAERIQGLHVDTQPFAGLGDRLGELTKKLDKRGVWPDDQMQSAASYVRTVRALLVDDTGTELRLLSELPLPWRGRALDVFGVPVANGNISFGLRWHGPRPALFWEANLAPEAPITITVPSIDTGFSTTERSGEALLADPGWKPTS